MLEWLTWEDVRSLADSELTWANLKSFGNSAFTTSLVGALAGAFAGAVAAQRIAERGKQSDQLLAEFRSTNAALTLAFSICNVAMAFKRQNAKPLYEAFVKNKADLLAHHQKLNAGEVKNGTPFSLEADLRSLQPPEIPLPLLETQVYDRLSATARPLALVTAIAAAYTALATAMRGRDELIMSWKSLDQQQFLQLMPTVYFGLPGNKTVDTRYADMLRAMFDGANNIIFFGELLCTDLAEHGANLQKKAHSRKLKQKLKKIHKVDFSKARAEGLMPSHAEYADWLQGFVRAPEEPTMLGRARKLFRTSH